MLAGDLEGVEGEIEIAERDEGLEEGVVDLAVESKDKDEGEGEVRVKMRI